MIRKNTFIWFSRGNAMASCLLVLFSIQLSAQNYMIVRSTNGSDKGILLSTLTKITFSSNEEQVNYYLSNAALYTQNTADIQKITFSDNGVLTNLAASSVDLSTAKNFAVSQNYPNPFNPSTVINYQIPRTGNVKAIVYDINGAEVKTLFAGVQEAGNYRLTWDGKNSSGQTAASGMYMFRVQHDAAVINKKMLLIK